MADATSRSDAEVELWRGAFGDEYVDRNAATAADVAARIRLWSEILRPLAGAPPRSFLEVGCNIGLNLRALRAISPAKLMAVEPNDKARERILSDGVLPEDCLKAGVAQAIPFADGAADLAFTSGVLIHIHPDRLLQAMREIHRCASRYIVCVEYFSTTPTTVQYRGHEDKLFKRDFGGYWLDNFPDLHVVDCGFAWRRTTGLDDLTWWVFGKGKA